MFLVLFKVIILDEVTTSEFTVFLFDDIILSDVIKVAFGSQFRVSISSWESSTSSFLEFTLGTLLRMVVFTR